MSAIGLKTLWSHWWRNPWQLATLIAGLALATALWSGVQAINAEARASYADASNTLTAGGLFTLVRQDDAPLQMADFVTLRRLGWQVSPVVEGTLDTSHGSLRVVGIEPLTIPQTDAGIARVDLGEIDGFFGENGTVFIHPSDVPHFENVTATLKTDTEYRSGQAIMDISAAQRLLGRDGDISYMIVAQNQPVGVATLPSDYRLRSANAQNDVARLTESFHLNLTAFGLLSFAVGIFIVYGSVGLAFEQRRASFRTLRALGMPLRRLMILLVIELGVFALIAGAIGVALGYLIAAALLPDVAATLRGLYGADVTGQLRLRPAWWASGLGMALVGTAIAAAAALYKLAHMPLLAFNHPRAMSLAASGAGRWLAVVALVLFALGAGVMFFSSGLIAGFTLLACLLVGAALCLPLVLATLLHLAARLSKSALAEWFWADSRQQLPGLSMALMALLLAMAANIGVSTMVSSFRLTFTDFLDQRLASELYVRASDPAQAEALSEFLTPRVDAILPIVSAPIRMGGLPAEIFGVRDHSTYRENWPMLSAVPDVWDRLARGQGALINEQLARREGLALGDLLSTGDAVLGVYGDYGNSAGQVVVSASVFAQRYPDARALQFGLRTTQPEKIAREIATLFDLPADAVINQADLKAFSLQIFERTFSVTAALNVLTLSVAGLAILISLLTLATMRLPQLAPVWALGFTRVGLARLELIRALCLATVTGALALPLGLALAWVLLAVVNVEAFGWRLPMYLFPADYINLGLLTILAAFLAALWPAVRLAQTPPQALLKVFSNER